MLSNIIIPTLQKKEHPEVMRISYTAMGLLAVNYFNNYKNFLKLFFDQIDKQNFYEFREFDMISLYIIFDSILQNNIQQENMPQELL